MQPPRRWLVRARQRALGDSQRQEQAEEEERRFQSAAEVSKKIWRIFASWPRPPESQRQLAALDQQAALIMRATTNCAGPWQPANGRRAQHLLSESAAALEESAGRPSRSWTSKTAIWWPSRRLPPPIRPAAAALVALTLLAMGVGVFLFWWFTLQRDVAETGVRHGTALRGGGQRGHADFLGQQLARPRRLRAGRFAGTDLGLHRGDRFHYPPERRTRLRGGHADGQSEQGARK